MERSQYTSRLIVILLVSLMLWSAGWSQSVYREPIYKAYSRGKMDVWFNLMHSCEKSHTKGNFSQEMELLNLYYGYTAWLIGAEKFNAASVYIKKSQALIDKMLERHPNNATLSALKGAYIAFVIATAKYKAIYLGSKSIELIDKSLQLDPNNIQGNIEKGNSLYYCPSMFGGDKLGAIGYYEKAVRLFEKKGEVVDNWMYINTMTVLGQAYEATNQIQKAKTIYEKIIRIYPNFMWVEEELYPDMLKRHNL